MVKQRIAHRTSAAKGQERENGKNWFQSVTEVNV
jgi:hypothetical protein